MKSVFKITKGIVALSQLLPDGRRQIVDFPMTGEICGMMEADGRYVLTARAIVDTEGCSFDRDRFEAFVERYPDVAREQRLSLQADLAFATQRALVLGRLLASEKLAHFLLEFGAACAAQGMDTQPLMLPMTRVDIADYLGLTVETISRTFADLRDANMTRTLDGGVLILDRRRLEELASGGLAKVKGLGMVPRPDVGRVSDVVFRPDVSLARPPL
jgi:CRP/FNR family transcriptional regulator